MLHFDVVQADELQMKFTQKIYCPQLVFISDGDTSINAHFLSLADVHELIYFFSVALIFSIQFLN